MSAKTTTTKTTGWWWDQLHNSVGKSISLETVDGACREGRLSGLRMTQTKFNGVDVDVLQELELNGDPTDCIPIDRISSIVVRVRSDPQ